MAAQRVCLSHSVAPAAPAAAAIDSWGRPAAGATTAAAHPRPAALLVYCSLRRRCQHNLRRQQRQPRQRGGQRRRQRRCQRCLRVLLFGFRAPGGWLLLLLLLLPPPPLLPLLLLLPPPPPLLLLLQLAVWRPEVTQSSCCLHPWHPMRTCLSACGVRCAAGGVGPQRGNLHCRERLSERLLPQQRQYLKQRRRRCWRGGGGKPAAEGLGGGQPGRPGAFPLLFSHRAAAAL
jgi:hypothetical protein